MPISSGALGWPASYFRKPEEEDDAASSTNGGGLSRTSTEKSTNGYAWTVQLSDRAVYENWRDQHDAKEAKRLAKERKRKEKRRKKEQARIEKQKARDDVEVVLSRRRRCRCLLLSLGSFLLLLTLLLGVVTLYVYYLEEDDLGPAVLFDTECKGQWRSHYLGYSQTYPNGTVYYVCCYLPDVNASNRYYTLAKGSIWPDGFVIPQAACPTISGNCEYFEKNNKFDPGTPPCSTGSHMALSSSVIGWIYYFVLYAVCDGFVRKNVYY